VDEKTAEQVKDDFLCWSGGFTPESERDIEIFVKYARDERTDSAEVAELLRKWMKEQLDSGE
jgi:hypothetical protein